MERCEYVDCDVVFIEEGILFKMLYSKFALLLISCISTYAGQFFSDLYDFCYKAVEIDCKLVVVSGLDGDFQRKAFGQLLDLIPLADRVDKLSALCTRCHDGTAAIFSKRVVKGTEQIAVGGLDSYIPVCRFHYQE